MPACDRCGHENPEGARFCNACAAALTEIEPRETRKTVTVLFSDVTGSTELGERLDPETLRRVMSRYFAEMRAVLERHGATVEKYIGDAVMAVFGIPAVHEDDALRAVRAAVEMRTRLAELNDELERDRGVRIRARTGVNTGEVVAGDPARGHGFATGDTVNVAARLEQAAQPDEILLGEDTYRLVRDVVRADPVEPLALKGKGDPVSARRLLELADGEATGRVRRSEVPMVGRARQLALLLQSFEAAVETRSCHLFTVLGPAGVGKSRLVDEFLEAVDGATVAAGRCLPYGEGITFWAIGEALRGALGPAHARLHEVLGEDDEADRIAAVVAGVVGDGESSGDVETTMWGVRRFLEALAREQPVILVLDDLHWAEPTLLDLVEHVADWAREAPILVICLARAELLDARPTWGGGKLNATSALLEPLGERDSERLLTSLLGGAPADDVAARIVSAAEGNPLFLEELLAVLVEDGVLKETGGRWEAATELSAVKVPSSINALLAARLDRLSEDEQETIRRASVEGRVFHRGALVELLPAAVGENAADHLAALVRKELVRPTRSELAGDEAFRFRHQLIRDAAYEGLPKELRAELHERFADWLDRAAGVLEREEVLGYHLEQSYRYRTELGPPDERTLELARRASALLGSAGRRAHAHGDLPAAAKLLERAVELAPERSAERIELMIERGAVLTSVEGDAVLAAAIEEAVEIGDRRLELLARIERESMRAWIDPATQPEETLAVLEEGTALFEEIGDDLALARAWQARARLHMADSRWQAMREADERAAVHAERAGDEELALAILSSIPVSLCCDPTPVPEALRRTEEIRARVGDHPRAHTPLFWSAGLYTMLGDFDEARARLAAVRAMIEGRGRFVERTGAIGLVSGLLELWAGDPQAAERDLRHCCDLLVRVGETGVRSTLTAYLGEALYRLGRYDEASRAADESEALAAVDDRLSQVWFRIVRAKALAQARKDGAEAAAREAVALAADSDYVQLQGDAWAGLGETLVLLGRDAEATEAFEHALSAYERKGIVPEAARMRSLLGSEAPSRSA